MFGRKQKDVGWTCVHLNKQTGLGVREQSPYSLPAASLRRSFRIVAEVVRGTGVWAWGGIHLTLA